MTQHYEARENKNTFIRLQAGHENNTAYHFRMSSFLRITLLLFIGISLSSCSKEGPTETIQIKHTGKDTKAFISSIKGYLKAQGISKCTLENKKGTYEYDVIIPLPQKTKALTALESFQAMKKGLTLAFHLAHPQRHIDTPPPGYVELPFRDDKTRKGIVQSVPAIDVRENIKTAAPFFSQGSWGLTVDFNDEIVPTVETVTRENVGKQLAIVLDNKILSMPVIQEPFSLGCSITGDFTEAEARQLAIALMIPIVPEFEIME